MNTVLVGTLLFTLIALGTPATFFFRRAIPLRRERPELLRNGLWFMLPFLLMPFTFLLAGILAPVSLGIVLVCLLLRFKKGAWFYVTIGEVVASVSALSLLFVVNTFFLPQR